MDISNPAGRLPDIALVNSAGERLGLETRLRPAKTVPVPVVNNTPNIKAKTDYFGVPGTITVFVGRSAGSIDRVRQAVQEGGKSVLAIVNEIHAGGPAAPPTLEQAFNTIAAAPVFATLFYGGTALVENLHIPEGRDLIGFTLPYNGGRLASQGFELRQFYKKGAPLYEVIALQTMPDLTAAEKAALEQVPEPELWRNIGVLRDCIGACVAAGIAWGLVVGGLAAAGGLVFGAAAAAGAGAVGAAAGAAVAVSVYNAVVGGDGADAGDAGDGGARFAVNLKLTDEDVRRLGAEGTALALLELRRAALLRGTAG